MGTSRVAVVAWLLCAGCHGQSEQGASAAPAVGQSVATAAPAPPRAAGAKPAWWCLPSVEGSTKACDRELAGCQRHRARLSSHGHPLGECTARDRAFCFAVTAPAGHAELRCAAELAACRTRRDVMHAHGTSDVAMTECAEQGAADRAVAAPAPDPDTRWWCIPPGDAPERCWRQLSTCQHTIKALIANGSKTGECVPRDRAVCFARGDADGNAELVCTTDLPNCRGMRDVLITDRKLELAMSECVERR